MAGDEHVADIVIVDGRVEMRPPTPAEGERETLSFGAG